MEGRNNWFLDQLMGSTSLFVNPDDPDYAKKWCFMATGFQSQVNVQPAPAVEGDFASHNPRFVTEAGPGGFVAGPNGAVVGRWAWVSGPVDGDGMPAYVSTSYAGISVLAAGGSPIYGTNQQEVLGLVHREQQSVIPIFNPGLPDSTLTVQPGFPVSLFKGGSFWVKNRGATTAQIGHKVYANFADGGSTFNVTGQAPTGPTITGTIAPALATITATIAGNILTVSALASGTLSPGMTLSGSGLGQTVTAGTTITAQLSGSAVGGLGSYSVTQPEQNIPSAITMSGSVGLLTINSQTGGTAGVGQLLSGTGGGGVAAGTIITGAGPVAGTFYVNPSQTVTLNPSIAGQTAIETKFFAMSNGLAGELVKISDQPLG